MTFAFNGTGTTAANVRIEGVSAMNPWQQYHQTYVPSIEAIANVNVVTNSADAEQGTAGGASVNVMLKSGTNAVHGAGFAYNIDSAFEANNWFANASGISKPPHLVDNNVGGNMGGPILRNKLFYFGSYEGDYLRQANSGVFSIPNQLTLSGNFTGSNNPIYDPMTGAANGTGRTAFPGNIIPPSRINPVIAKIIPFVPATNLPGVVNNYYGNLPSFYNLHKIDTKIDYTATSKLRISGRYAKQPYNNYFAPLYGDTLGGASPGGSLNCGACNYLQNGATLAISNSATYIFSPTFIIDGTWGVTEGHQFLYPNLTNTRYGSDVLGIPGTNTGPLPWAGGVPNFAVANFVTMGYSYPALDYLDPLFEYVVNATKIKGSHSVRFGVDISRQHQNHIEISPTAFTFTGGITALSGGPGPNAYNAVADFLLGLPQSDANYTQVLQPYLTLRTWEFTLYAKDQWQVNRKLTVNYGLRWEHYPVPTQATKGITYYNPSTDIIYACGVGGLNGNCNTGVSNKIFAPSLGIAYRMFESFVIRAGVAISPFQQNMSSNGLKSYPDEIGAIFSGANSYTSLYGYQSSQSISNGIPVIPPAVLTNGTIMAPPGTGNIFTNLPYFKRGYFESFNFTLQKEFKGGWIGQAGYVGTHGVNLYSAVNINYGTLGGGAASQPLFQYGITGSTSQVQPFLNDIYESFQSTLKRRFSNGFTLQMAYTFSHDISQTTSILIPQYRDRGRYTTSLDRTHALVISGSYELPFGHGKQYVKSGIGAAILGGWTLNGLFTHYSGSPFSVTASAASCNCPGNSQVANQVLPNVAIVGNGLNGHPYFNPLAYAPVTNAAFGNSGFNSLRGPGSTNQDLNIFRDFKLTERFKLQIRGEALNLSNTPHFSNPGSNVSNYVSPTNLGGFSQITSTNPLGRIIDARYFRFGLRVMF
jgi:hypothetical protein